MRLQAELATLRGARRDVQRRAPAPAAGRGRADRRQPAPLFHRVPRERGPGFSPAAPPDGAGAPTGSRGCARRLLRRVRTGTLVRDHRPGARRPPGAGGTGRDGRTAQTWAFHAEGLEIRIQVVAAGQCVYTLMSMWRGPAPDVDRFLDGFRVLKDCAADE